MNISLNNDRIKEYDRKADAIDFIDSKPYFMFGFEKSEKGNMKYGVCFFQDFLEHIKNNRRRVYHEFIFPNKPCRFAVDIDKEIELTDIHEIYIKSIQLASDFELLIKKQLGNIIKTQPEIFYSSREKKISIHMIWGEFFEIPRVIYILLKTLNFNDSLIKVTDIDFGIYPISESSKSLRMPFCYKLKAITAPLQPITIINEKVIPQSFTIPKFVNGLLTITNEIYFFGTNNVIDDYRNVKDIQLFKLQDLDKFGIISTPAVIYNKKQKYLYNDYEEVEAYFSCFFADFKHQQYDKDSKTVICKMYCFCKGDVHLNHYMYVGIDNPSGKIYQTCPDVKCDKKFYYFWDLNIRHLQTHTPSTSFIEPQEYLNLTKIKILNKKT